MATLRDVAVHARVSVKTASRALRGERYVHADTAARVHAAATELGFALPRGRHDLGAASLATVALVSGDTRNPFWSALARGAERELATADLLLVTASHEESPSRQERLLRALVAHGLDGLLLVPAPGSCDLTADLTGVSVVVVDRPLRAPRCDEVIFDDRAGAASAVRALAGRGHTRIAFVGAEQGLWTVTERLAGYREGLFGAGLREDLTLVRLDCTSTERAAAATRDLLRRPDPPTAVVAMNNLIARGVVDAARAADVPLDIGGFDSDSDPELFRIAPFTVVNDPVAAGRAAAAMLVDRLRDHRRPVRRQVMPASLVVRPFARPA